VGLQALFTTTLQQPCIVSANLSRSRPLVILPSPRRYSDAEGGILFADEDSAQTFLFSRRAARDRPYLWQGNDLAPSHSSRDDERPQALVLATGILNRGDFVQHSGPLSRAQQLCDSRAAEGRTRYPLVRDSAIDRIRRADT
jgi:hypothetical protein